MAAPQPPAPFGGGAAATKTVHAMEEYISADTTQTEFKEQQSITPAESDELRDQEIAKLARTFSQLSQQQSTSSAHTAVNTFLDPSKDPELDPNSSDFSSRKWVRNTLRMTRDPAQFPRRTAGVSWRNMNVFGYGTAADYQMNFANMWLKMVDGAKHWFGLGQKVRIDILRDFEGIVDHGEMLVVLGRPGR